MVIFDVSVSVSTDGVGVDVDVEFDGVEFNGVDGVDVDVDVEFDGVDVEFDGVDVDVEFDGVDVDVEFGDVDGVGGVEPHLFSAWVEMFALPPTVKPAKSLIVLQTVIEQVFTLSPFLEFGSR